MSIRFIIDSASDYSDNHPSVTVLPLIVSIDSIDYYDGVNLTRD